MLVTIFYVIGALSLHFTDVSSQHAFFSLLLPLINILFFIFLLWQLIYYFSLNAFSHNDDNHFFDLMYRLWNLDEDIKQRGFFPALIHIFLLLMNTTCLFTALFYYIDLFLDFF